MKKISAITLLFFGIYGCGEKEEDSAVSATNDADGDGFTDQEELDCSSDPENADDHCYTCGWEHNDPGTLVSTGNELGDVMASVVLPDQCGDQVDLWDFHGEYHVLYMTAAW